MSDFNTLLAVKDLMTQDIVTAQTSISAREAAKLLADKAISSVVMVDDTGAIAGILTERDIVTKVVAEGRDASGTKAGEVMTEEARQISADNSIFEARKLMTDLGVKHLIVEEGGKPIGLVSATALLGG